MSKDSPMGPQYGPLASSKGSELWAPNFEDCLQWCCNPFIKIPN